MFQNQYHCFVPVSTRSSLWKGDLGKNKVVDPKGSSQGCEAILLS